MLLLALSLFCVAGLGIAQATAGWKVCRQPGGACTVTRVGEKPVVGIQVAGSFAAASSVAGGTPSFAEVIDLLPFTAAEGKRILHGELVRSMTKESSEREIVVAMAFLVHASPDELIGVFREALDYDVDELVVASGTIDGEGAIDAFAKLRLEPNGDAEAERYLSAKPGEELNLSTGEIEAFRVLKKSSGSSGRAAVEAQIRRNLLLRYQAYRARGLDGIAPYARGRGEFDPAGDLRGATRAAVGIRKLAPQLWQVLLDYPAAKPPGLEEKFLWVDFAIDGRPTIALNHRLSLSAEDGRHFVAERHYYVSCGLNSVQVVGGMLPVEEGTIVFYINRTSTDQVAGLGSSAKRGIGRRIMGGQIAKNFEAYRKQFAD